MTKHFIYTLAEVVMFVLSSNPNTIVRMKKRAGGFFKGRVLKETSKDVWIEPLNDDLVGRLAKTSFFQEVAVIKGRFVVTLNGRDMTDPQGTKYVLRVKYNTEDVRFADCVVIPKKQVEHWLGEKRRMADALDRLATSPLVKKGNTKKAKAKKTSKWVYRS